MEGKGSEGVWDGHVHTAIFKMGNRDLLYSIWNSSQCYMAAWIGGEFGGEWMDTCIGMAEYG